MRTIQISTEVFAAIWKARMPGEDREDHILERILKLPSISKPLVSNNHSGYIDKRFNLFLPEGFTIERSYKGKNYQAIVSNGSWILDNNSAKSFKTIAELNDAINATTSENAWKNWYYISESGARRQISDLRDPTTIGKRNRKSF